MATHIAWILYAVLVIVFMLAVITLAVRGARRPRKKNGA